MIEKPPVLKVNRRFARAPQTLLAHLAGAATGHVVDVLGGRAALDHRIKAIAGTPTSFVGSVLTVHAGPGDCLATFAALREAKPGDVLVVATDCYGEAAATGDLLLAIAKKQGVVAFVTDGLVRDIPGIVGQGLPCFAMGVTPNSAHRTGPGSVGFPVTIGRMKVQSGDIMVGDQDGIVVIPADAFDGIVEKLGAVRAAERRVEAEIAAADGLPEFILASLRDVPTSYVEEADA